MIVANQVLVPGSAVALTTVQPGCEVAVTAFGGTIFVGTSGSVTTGTGAPLSGYCPLPVLPVTASPAQLFAISGGGTIAAGLIITGPR